MHSPLILLILVTTTAWAACISNAVARPKCESGKGFVAVDMASKVSPKFLTGIKRAGIETVIRYYDWEDETIEGKTWHAWELYLVRECGLKALPVFQHNNNKKSTFINHERGTIDAKRSLELASNLKQPTGSAIYFGVDGGYDIDFIKRHVGTYFERINDEFAGSGYRVGAYGSGSTCDYLLGQKLVSYCWLSNATGWPGYKKFEKSKKWVLKQHLTTRAKNCFGREVDLNTGNPRIPDYGQFTPVQQLGDLKTDQQAQYGDLEICQGSTDG